MTAIQEKLRDLIATAQDEHRRLGEMVSVLRKFDANPVSLDDLHREAAAQGTGGATYFQRIAEMFVRNGNKPMTVREIADAIQGVPTCVNNVLYGTHKQFFVSAKRTGFNRRLEWCLTQQAFDQFAQASS